MNRDEAYKTFFPITYDVVEGQDYKWCGCGKSATQPFCDTNDCTQYVIYHATLTETVSFCNCKQTQDPPLCDGSHGKVLMEYLKNQKR
jgi:CDGSH-type Zn-finger protein